MAVMFGRKKKNRNVTIPEQRVDKNGRVVTRHVKMDAQTPEPKDLPAPHVDDYLERIGIKPLEETGLHIDVLRGDIDIEVIKTVGVQTIAEYYSIRSLRDYLVEVSAERSPYDAEGLRQIINRANEKECSVSSIERLVRRIGMDAALEIEHAGFAIIFSSGLIADGKKSDEYIKTVVPYYDRILTARIDFVKGLNNDDMSNGQHLAFIDDEEVLAFHDAGVEPEKAISGIAKGLDTREIIAIEHEGIAPSVSNGWL